MNVGNSFPGHLFKVTTESIQETNITNVKEVEMSLQKSYLQTQHRNHTGEKFYKVKQYSKSFCINSNRLNQTDPCTRLT